MSKLDVEELAGLFVTKGNAQNDSTGGKEAYNIAGKLRPQEISEKREL